MFVFDSSNIIMIRKAIVNSSKYINESTADVVMINLTTSAVLSIFYLLSGGPRPRKHEGARRVVSQSFPPDPPIYETHPIPQGIGLGNSKANLSRALEPQIS